jgi:hypothetical protein
VRPSWAWHCFVAPTAELSAAELGEVRRLLHGALAGGFSDDDWGAPPARP